MAFLDGSERERSRAFKAWDSGVTDQITTTDEDEFRVCLLRYRERRDGSITFY